MAIEIQVTRNSAPHRIGRPVEISMIGQYGDSTMKALSQREAVELAVKLLVQTDAPSELAELIRFFASKLPD